MTDTPKDILALAEIWYRAQLRRIAARLGPHWEEHRTWIDVYLREQLRERLLARGWRLK